MGLWIGVTFYSIIFFFLLFSFVSGLSLGFGTWLFRKVKINSRGYLVYDGNFIEVEFFGRVFERFVGCIRRWWESFFGRVFRVGGRVGVVGVTSFFRVVFFKFFNEEIKTVLWYDGVNGEVICVWSFWYGFLFLV